MPIDLVDLEACEIYGPFSTPAEAKARAEKSNIRFYALWDNGIKVAQIDTRDTVQRKK